MDLEIRPVAEQEFESYFRAIESAFGYHPRPEDIAVERKVFELDRTLAAFDGPGIVGSAAADSLDVTVPGGTLPMAGVTGVAVVPTHRRRGLLTRLMRQQLEDIRDRGELVAGLWASEGGIYHRFGYGLSTLLGKIRIERERTAFVRPVPSNGSVQLVDKEEALRAMPGVYERVRESRAGVVSRPGAWWESLFSDLEHHREGASALFFALHRSGDRDQVDGYVAYRVKSDWPDLSPAGTVQVEELMGPDPAVYARLWRYCFDLDLISTIEAWRRPADEPLLLLLQEPRRLRLTLADSLWLRLVDLPGALAARSYRGSGRIVFEVADRTCPWNEGRFALEADADGARCEPTRADAEVSLDVADLGSAYLGGVRFSAMKQAGRIQEHAEGTVERADSMFSTDPLPWCPHLF